MKKTSIYTTSLLIFALALAVNIAQGQSPKSITNGSEANSGTLQFTHLLAQARPATRGAYPQMRDNTDANPNGSVFSLALMATGPNLSVLGGGTLGRLTKWTGLTSSNSFIGDSTIFEDKYGLVGIGTDTPTSPLTVAGIVQSTSGGFKFPDGTVQTTSSAGAISTVTHDMTLTGSGTVASPLGVASPLIVRDMDNPALQPVQASGICTAPDGFGGCSVLIYTVPQGKRLVIEFVSMLAVVPLGNQSSLDIGTKVNGQNFHFRTPYSQPAIGESAVAFTHIAQALRIYADPGTTVGATCSSTSTRGGTFEITFAGYLVNIP